MSTDATIATGERAPATLRRPRREPVEAADRHDGAHRATRWGSLALSLGALGVVYGDIGTSPL